jgi:hypothetical protein
MARSKLSEQEQQQIVSTYRGSPATAVELAEQFQVSISTVSRVLKENIAADEYQLLVNRKRSAARRKDSGEPEILPSDPPNAPFEAPAPSRPSRTRRRSSSSRAVRVDASHPLEDETGRNSGTEFLEQQQVLPLEPELSSPPSSIETLTETITAADSEELDPDNEDETDEDGGTEGEMPAEELELVAELQEDLEDVEEDDEDETDEDSDLEEEEDDEEEDDSDYFLEDGPEEDRLADPGYQFQVLPLEELIPPETCYAVIDRYQELATRPLKEFFNLGSLPPEGIDSANTLPIFDNHRVARRFSEMSRRGSNTYPPYRVIQFSGHILETVRTQLQNKGITHLLMDGQIYTL